MFKIYDEPESASKGACLRYMMNSFANQGACCRDMMNPPNKGGVLNLQDERNRQMRGVFNVHDEPESPNERARLRYESASRNEGTCYMFNSGI